MPPVWHIAKRLGWVPPSAGREEAYAHLNTTVPDAAKYTLHVLLVRHGKSCRACSKGSLQLPEVCGPCPLTALASGGGKLRQQLLALAEELGVGVGKGKAAPAAAASAAARSNKKKAVKVKKEVV